MKSTFYYLFLSLVCFHVLACGNETTEQEITDKQTTEAKSDLDAPTEASITVKKPSCPLTGEMLEENEFWVEELNKVVRIVATEETEDPKFGESHRVLQIINGENCAVEKTEILPVSVSPDFAYYFADITYNNTSKVIALCGFNNIICYDIEQGKRYKSVEPTFINERFGVDAQSGNIKRLEVWENYLIGYAQDFGSFVFDIKKGQPEVVEPFAEFELLEGEQYNSLFLLPSKNGMYQAILPSYDRNKQEFKINPIFQEPLYLNNQMNPKYRDNRFQLLTEVISDSEKNVMAIDMRNRKQVDLPKGISERQNTEILEWLKKR